jgi:hypothetical protein
MTIKAATATSTATARVFKLFMVSFLCDVVTTGSYPYG